MIFILTSIILAPSRKAHSDWKQMHSWWGKMGVVLFYAYIMYNLITGIWETIRPYGGYLPCLREQFASTGTDVDIFVTFLFRMFHFWHLGFYLHAGILTGYQDINMIMIVVFTALTAFSWNHMAQNFQETASQQCLPGDRQMTLWYIMIVWPGLALLLHQVDQCLAIQQRGGIMALVHGEQRVNGERQRILGSV